MILSKRLPTSDISKLNMINWVRNIGKSCRISKIRKTNEICKISQINEIRKRNQTNKISI